MIRAKDRLRLMGVPLTAAALFVCAAPCWARDEVRPGLPRVPAAVSWRSDGGNPAASPQAAPAPAPAPAPKAATLFLPAPRPAESTLFSQYRRALEKESRRMADRNPALSWNDMVDEDGYPLRGADRVQRDARKLFGGAGNRMMSGWLEQLIGESAGLRAVRGTVEGLRLDVRKDGGLGMGAGAARDSSEVATSFSLMVLGRPRLEMRSTLPWNLKARIEVPLTANGVRATMSRRFATGLRGTFTVGSEDDERWVSAGVEVDF